MNVLLKQDIYNLGRKGDIARAKNGYAAYLIRTNQAVLPTKGILYLKKRLQEERKEQEKVMTQEAEKLSKELMSTHLTFDVKIDENEQMYGSVTMKQVIERLNEKNMDLNIKQIAQTKHIKSIGEHKVPFKLYNDIESFVRVTVNGVHE